MAFPTSFFSLSLFSLPLLRLLSRRSISLFVLQIIIRAHAGPLLFTACCDTDRLFFISCLVFFIALSAGSAARARVFGSALISRFAQPVLGPFVFAFAAWGVSCGGRRWLRRK